MTWESEIQLAKKYPKILRDYKGDMRKTAMAWGFEFNDGWYNLTEETLDKLNLISLATGFDIILDQAKEKMAGLRIYWHLEDTADYDSEYLDKWYDIINDVILMAEYKSKNICEVCGKYGQVCNKGYWVKTLCKEDAKKLGYKYKE